jgi:hypothetical protein
LGASGFRANLFLVAKGGAGEAVSHMIRQV